MTITTYSELQTAIANWSSRSGLTARLPEFITLCEARIKNGSMTAGYESEPLRTRVMQSTTTLVTVAGTSTVALPTGWLGFKGDLYISGNSKTRLTVETLDNLHSLYLGSTSGLPRAYAIAGTNIHLGPTPDAIYNIPVIYWALLALSVSQTTNAVLTNYPNIYLFGSLLELSIYTRNWENAKAFYGMFMGAVNAANSVDTMETFSGSTPQVRTDWGNP
jgi:hypothetical protein